MNFSELGLSPRTLEAVTAAGYTTPTPIQAEAIPPALQRRDVMGLAQTGSGKTAAFVLPMLSLLEKGRARARMPRTLILEPTRELADQVREAFETLGKMHNLSVALLIGGVAFEPQALKIDRGADVVIATPGPPARSFRARQAAAHRHRHAGDRRGRPHARHGLHPGHRAHLQAAALHPADHVLLRHHAAGDPAPHHRLPAQSGARRGLAAPPPRRRPSPRCWSRPA